MWHQMGAMLAYLRAIWLGVVSVVQMGWLEAADADPELADGLYFDIVFSNHIKCF